MYVISIFEDELSLATYPTCPNRPGVEDIEKSLFMAMVRMLGYIHVSR